MILRRIDIKKAIAGLLALTIVSLITAISPAHAQEAVQSVTVSSEDAALDKALSDNPSIMLAQLELEKSKVELEKKKRELKKLKDADESDERDIEILEKQIYFSELADAQISFDSAMHELNIILGNSLETQISAVEGFAISNYDIDAIDAAAVTARAQRADSSIANLESSAETSRLEYEKQVAYYTEINLNAKILKATYDKNLESLEQAKKEIEKDVVESVASLKNSRQQLALQKESIDNQKKRFEAKSKEFELGHASLNELQEQYLSLQEKTLSYYQSIYQYNIDIMNFVSTYGG